MDGKGVAADGSKMPQPSKACDSLSSGVGSGLNTLSNKSAPGGLGLSRAGLVTDQLTDQIQPSFLVSLGHNHSHSFLYCLRLLWCSGGGFQ